MKEMLKFLPALLLLGLCSCEQKEMENLAVVASVDSQNNMLSVEDKTIDLVKSFKVSLVNSSEEMTKSDLSQDNITINDCEKTTYHFSFDNITTRSNIQIPDTASIDVYLVNFHEADGTPGYSIVTADERINKVYLYSKGEIGDTAKIYPLACVVKSIPSVLKKDLVKYYLDPTSKTQSRGLITTYGPHINTHWDQEYPYNYKCKAYPELNNDVDLRGHAPAGCSTIATAQTVAYYGKFKSNYTYNFFRLRSDARIDPSNSEMVSQVSQLCSEIAYGIGVDWGVDETNLPDPRKISTYLSNKHGYTTETWNDENVDIVKMANNIIRGNVHITAGMRKSPISGHVWIWDGVQINPLTFEVTMVHCNWGQGNYNEYNNGGYYNDSWFTPATMEQPDKNLQPYFDDNVQIYITDYQYNPGPIG